MILTALLSAPAAEPLRWGADPSGGEPYVSRAAGGRYAGFEVDLAALIGKKVGRDPVLVPGDWSTLPQRLDRGDIDIVLNGYEYAPRRQRLYPASLPYYIYDLRLFARKGNATIRSWDDLHNPVNGRKPRVVVLPGSGAEKYVRSAFGDSVELIPDDNVTSRFDDLSRRDRIDAIVQDNVVVPKFARQFPGVVALPGGRAPGYYVILTRKNDTELRKQIDEALRELSAEGELRRIYDKYDIWNANQEKLPEAFDDWPPGGEAERVGWGELLSLLFEAAGVTVLLAVLAMPLAVAVGMAVAIGRLYGPLIVRLPLAAYVELLRGTPLLLQLWFLYYLLPRLLDAVFGPGHGLEPSAFTTAVIGLGLNYSAYEAEIYRAGLLAVPRGQAEAALALGMTRGTALRRVVVPQAFRTVLPPVTNDFIALFKDTSVCSVIAVTELTKRYNTLYNGNPDLLIELAALTAGLYMLMSFPLSLAVRRFERKM